MILTEIGEVGIHTEGRDITLRPSLFAMSALGEPEEIVELFTRVMGEGPLLGECVHVLWCCTERDISDLTGSLGEDNQWERGAMGEEEIVHLARCLLKHGIVGVMDAKPRRKDNPTYVKRFVAREYVAMAMAHLGLPEREAWGMTMTGLVGALAAKFPQPEDNSPGAKAPSSEEHEATMDWYEKVQAMRQQKRKEA